LGRSWSGCWSRGAGRRRRTPRSSRRRRSGRFFLWLKKKKFHLRSRRIVSIRTGLSPLTGSPHEIAS
jgi:hypothetical protein